VEQRRQRYGPNEWTRRRQRGPLLTFLLQFHQPLIYILLVATAVTLWLDEYLDAAVIFGVVLVNAIVGFVQEYRAARAIEALARSIPELATVVRDGRKERVAARTLVPGDVVLLQSGDRVPADLRLVRVRELRTAEAALTGESTPVEKQTEPLPPETLLADRSNMAFASSLVTYGQGVGIVVATGDRTEVGRIAAAVAEAEEIATPLTRRIAHFSRVLLVVILSLAAVNFLVGVLRGLEAGEMFLASVALAVAAIPEGLPAAVTIMLAIGVSRMAARRAVIRKLPAVETLGSTTVICSDKTGTLTQNQMTVTRLLAGGECFAVSGVGYEPKGEIRYLGEIGLREEQNPALCWNACVPVCFAMMLSWSKKQAATTSTAIRPKGRSSSPLAKPAWTPMCSRRSCRASMCSPLNRSGSTWRRCMRPVRIGTASSTSKVPWSGFWPSVRSGGIAMGTLSR
jgi:magnesium-transporting ATPase (P-type)